MGRQKTPAPGETPHHPDSHQRERSPNRKPVPWTVTFGLPLPRVGQDSSCAGFSPALLGTRTVAEVATHAENGEVRPKDTSRRAAAEDPTWFSSPGLLRRGRQPRHEPTLRKSGGIAWRRYDFWMAFFYRGAGVNQVRCKLSVARRAGAQPITPCVRRGRSVKTLRQLSRRFAKWYSKLGRRW